MRLKININMDNAAFDAGDGSEVVRILRKYADRIEARTDSDPADALDSLPMDCPLMDINGNRVGRAVLIDNA